MNKSNKLAIKAILIEHIEDISNALCRPKPHAKKVLQLELLESALCRIEASNFGECFCCEKPIPLETLLVSPERKICDGCM